MKIYEKDWFVVLMLILFFPVGLYLMWKHTKWNKVVKIVISVFFGIMIICSSGNENKTNSVSNNVKTEVSQKNKYEELENNCDAILNSKDYYNMTEEEKQQINDVIDKIDKLSDDFKNKNNDLIEKYKEDKYYDENYEGVIVANIKEEVKRQLKSPNSADFPWSFSEYHIKYVGESEDGFYQYTVVSYVDAINSFNAKLRKNYYGVIYVSKDLNKYKASVYIEE